MDSKLTIAAISVAAGVLGAAATMLIMAPAPDSKASVSALSTSMVKGQTVSKTGLTDKPQSMPVPCPIWMMFKMAEIASKR